MRNFLHRTSALRLYTLLALVLFWGCERKTAAPSRENAPPFAQTEAALRNGDVIFQTSLSAQSQAIALATRSKYTHVGVLYQQSGGWVVLEAVQPVKITPLAQWIRRGKNQHFVVKRLKNAEQILTAETLRKMKREGEKFLNKNYDSQFLWSDDKIYCSELVYKIYERGAGVSLCPTQRYRDFDLQNPQVANALKRRFSGPLPLDEEVVSPASLFDSEKLTVVFEN